MMIVRLTMAIVVAAGLATAQDQTPADNPPQNPAAKTDVSNIGPNSPQWKGLTVGEKLRYDWIHLFDVQNVVFAAMGSGIDQARDRPDEWGEGWGAYGKRFASHIGYYVVQRSIMFPVQAIDHEDTRYFRSTRTSYQGRIADALLHTVWRHNDSGGMMPAYSEFLGDYGAAAVSRLWWPSSYHKASSILIAGSDTVLVDAGINVFNEFKPDLKRWLHLNH